MNGPEHFREAERLLRPRPVGERPADWEIAQGAAHATLALAAATALQFHLDLLSRDPESPGSEWRGVIS